MPSKRIPELDVGTMGMGSLFETAQVDGSSATGYNSTKVSASDVANYAATQQQYSDLDTDAKTLVGAINEAAQGGGGSSTFSGLSDVQFGTLYNGQIPKYDSAAQKWKNVDLFLRTILECWDGSTVGDDIDNYVPNQFTPEPVLRVMQEDGSNDFDYAFIGCERDSFGAAVALVFARCYVNSNGDNVIKTATLVDSTDNPHTEMTVTFKESVVLTPLTLSGVLSAGSTTVTISDARIKGTMLVDVYTDAYGVSPSNVVVTNGSCVLTFEAQASNMTLKVRFSN